MDLNKRISDMMDGFTEEAVNITARETASAAKIKEAVMNKIHNEEKYTRSRYSANFARIAALAAAFMLLIGGGVYARASGGLSEFLSLFIPDREVSERLDSPSEDAVSIVKSEGEDYGALWTIDEYWYDGANLYFTAEAPQKIVEAGNMLVECSDHADVNGTDCALSALGCWDADTGSYTGRYTCQVDLSKADTASGDVRLTVDLKCLRYNDVAMPAFSIIPAEVNTAEKLQAYMDSVETVTEQTLSFSFESSGVLRQVRDKILPVSGGSVKLNLSIAPSLFSARIVYQTEDPAKSVGDIAKYRITDGEGNSISVWVSGIDYEDDSLSVKVENLDGLNPYSNCYTFEPMSVDFDAEDKALPDSGYLLDWGGFMVEMG